MIAIGEQRMLESCGYQVVVAGTGEEALEICNSEPEIDLILMDIELGAGRLSGPETAMQILKTRQLPVIFLSGHTNPEVVAQTQKISAYGYVVKSSDGTTLDALIKMALRLFQANARLEEIQEQITERKHAEDKIKALLEDKKRLLEEVHHRIKNVLYSIKSLLALQASAESGADARESLLAAANRVQSMMMLYDKLQKSSDYLSVSTQSYLSSLAVAVVASFTGNVPVTLEKSIEDCLLSAEKCQPLGLILNELLTNAMTHAFAGKSRGKAVVTFRVDEGRGVLVVHDDGRGLPESIDFNKNSHSLGLRLVHLLSKQIGGTVRAERGNGTKVIVEFPSSGILEEGG